MYADSDLRKSDGNSGLIGSIILGIAASFLAWVTALRAADIWALLGGCFLAGIGGSNFIGSQVKVRNLQSATNDAMAAATRAAEGIVQPGSEPEKEA
jgi:hypothetical protein